jgi:hypothetical protein
LILQAQLAEEPKSTSIFDNLLSFSDRGTGSTFYFDNGVAMQQGTIDFYRTWGNRTLQDNWRRSAASFQNTNPTISAQTTTDTTSEESTLLNQLPDVETLLSQIPSTPEAVQNLNLELEESRFELGKLLYFDLNETELSIENLETLVREYPNSTRKPEAYYLLYLGNKDLGGNFDQYASRLNREFPDSQYTYSVNNPGAVSGNLAYIESSKRYEEAYNAYYAGNYSLTKQLVKSTLEEFALTRNTERLILLDIMATGKTESRERYRERLESYIENTQDEQLVELARNMLKPMLSSAELVNRTTTDSTLTDSTKLAGPDLEDNEGKKELQESPYKINESQTHIFVIAMEPGQAESAKGILGDLENFHAKNFSNARLRTGNMNMNRENSIFIISPFSNAQKALEYYEKFQEEFESEGLPVLVKENSFFISIENFQELNKSKNIEEYRTFFKSVYK